MLVLGFVLGTLIIAANANTGTDAELERRFAEHVRNYHTASRSHTHEELHTHRLFDSSGDHTHEDLHSHSIFGGSDHTHSELHTHGYGEIHTHSQY